VALILLVEDEELLTWSLAKRLEKEQHRVHAADDLAHASEYLRLHQPDLMILDLALPDGHGLDFYQENRERLADTVVLIMTAVGGVDDAVRAMKLGALDFLTKPVEHEALVRMVARALEHRSRGLEAERAREDRERQLSMEVIAHSPAFQRTLEVATNVARSNVETILIQGESGTGKNLLARYIHAESQRHAKPLMEISCPTIPDQLMESELFGHERGAFTDAKRSRRGTFELANDGTVVLDEIGELKVELQPKLLHFLEERHFRRVGGTREIHVDVCVVALTNRDMRAMIRDGLMREDLFFRLNVFPITVPTLRCRREDILPLAHQFLQFFRGKLGQDCDGLTREAENLMLAYPWPGNVRELRHTIERALILEQGPELTCRSLLLEGASELYPEELAEDLAALPPGIVPLEVMEREMVRRALEATGGNQSRAAELLGVTRDQVRYRVKKITRDEATRTDE
jgi:two-component system response regulator AtoC